MSSPLPNTHPARKETQRDADNAVANSLQPNHASHVAKAWPSPVAHSICMHHANVYTCSGLLIDKNHPPDARYCPSPVPIMNTQYQCVSCSANKLQLPSQQAGILVLRRLLGGCRLATQVLPAVHSAAAQLLAQLSMTYFMPFCLTALSMVARIQVCSPFF